MGGDTVWWLAAGIVLASCLVACVAALSDSLRLRLRARRQVPSTADGGLFLPQEWAAAGSVPPAQVPAPAHAASVHAAPAHAASAQVPAPAHAAPPASARVPVPAPVPGPGHAAPPAPAVAQVSPPPAFGRVAAGANGLVMDLTAGRASGPLAPPGPVAPAVSTPTVIPPQAPTRPPAPAAPPAPDPAVIVWPPGGPPAAGPAAQPAPAAPPPLGPTASPPGVPAAPRTGPAPPAPPTIRAAVSVPAPQPATAAPPLRSAPVSGQPFPSQAPVSGQPLPTPVPSGAPRSSPPATSGPGPVEIRVLGPLEVRTPGAPHPAYRKELASLVAMAALSPDGIPGPVVAACLPDAGLAGSLAQHLRDWLGTDDSGVPRLGERDGSWRLAADVRVDWHTFRMLVDGPGPPDESRRLAAALALIRGGLCEGVSLPESAKHVLAPHLVEVGATVVRAVRRDREIAAAVDDPARAEWALRQGLVLLPREESLWRMRLGA